MKFRFFLAIIALSFLSSCHVGRYFYWNFADVNDGKRFPSLEVNNDTNHIRQIPTIKNLNIKLPESYADFEGQTFSNFLRKHSSLAFIIIHNDSIKYEIYFDSYADTSLFTSFSVAKSFVSSLIGIAVDEGLMDVDSSINAYVGGLSDKFDSISIGKLLNMRSGIAFNEAYYNPFGLMAKFYYGRNLRAYVNDLKANPDGEDTYKYQSCNTQLLAFALENVYGMKLIEILEEKLWKPLGMEKKARWNVDSKKHNNIKAFCCINAIARDFARYGLLYLHEGNINNTPILSAGWIQETKNADTAFVDSQGYPYHYHWRVMDKHRIFAKGILGQYIYVDSKKNIVMLRLGKKYGGIDWAGFMKEISGQFQAL